MFNTWFIFAGSYDRMRFLANILKISSVKWLSSATIRTQKHLHTHTHMHIYYCVVCFFTSVQLIPLIILSYFLAPGFLPGSRRPVEDAVPYLCPPVRHTSGLRVECVATCVLMSVLMADKLQTQTVLFIWCLFDAVYVFSSASNCHNTVTASSVIVGVRNTTCLQNAVAVRTPAKRCVCQRRRSKVGPRGLSVHLWAKVLPLHKHPLHQRKWNSYIYFQP